MTKQQKRKFDGKFVLKILSVTGILNKHIQNIQATGFSIRNRFKNTEGKFIYHTK